MTAVLCEETHAQKTHCTGCPAHHGTLQIAHRTGHARSAKVHGRRFLAPELPGVCHADDKFRHRTECMVPPGAYLLEHGRRHGHSGCDQRRSFFATNGEPYFLWAKFGQYIPQARKEYIDGEFLLNLEKLASTPKAKARIKNLQQRLAARAAAAAAKAAN